MRDGTKGSVEEGDLALEDLGFLMERGRTS
jgi:hypothetical protein